jgi:hypothetical protein
MEILTSQGFDPTNEEDLAEGLNWGVAFLSGRKLPRPRPVYLKLLPERHSGELVGEGVNYQFQPI